MVFRELMTETHLAWRGQLQQKHCSETLLQRDVPAAWCVSPSVGSILPGRRQREVEERAWGTSSLAKVGGIEWCRLLLRANWRELWWGWSTQQSKLETFFSKILEAPVMILLTKKILNYSCMDARGCMYIHTYTDVCVHTRMHMCLHAPNQARSCLRDWGPT